MQGVKQDFFFDGALVVPSLFPRHGGADEDFSVGKGDDVRLGRIVEEVVMNARHRGTIDEHEFHLVQMFRQSPGKERQGSLKPPQK